MMDVPKALVEVWNGEKVRQEEESWGELSQEELCKKINLYAEEIQKKWGLNLKTS